nr:4Fe-4S single cluster domain-containing protein [Pseudenhygromyxa sp. WMMC2535]
MRVAHRVPRTRAEGPHERWALWLQGCSLRCPGCCNPELFDPAGGALVEVDVLLAELAELAPGRAAPRRKIEGVTILGGEPLEQLEALTELCEGAAGLGLGVLVFTGLRLEEARARPGFAALWASLDTLVDGRFEARAREPEARAGGRRFVGSRNQTLHHRSPRYADPAVWAGANSAELRVEADGSVSVHGFPSAARSLLRLLAAPAPVDAKQSPN